MIADYLIRENRSSERNTGASSNVRPASTTAWSCAIETHSKNYSWATHFHSKIQELRPRDIIKDERTDLEKGDTIHLLIGCPDCTYFSSARGGGPKDPDSRATPREILDYIERLDVRNLLFDSV